MHFANEILFEDEEEEEERLREPKIVNFVEDVIHCFEDKQFKRHFRMDPSTMEHLLQRIQNVIPEVPVAKGHPQLTIEKQLLITVWYLANIECFRSVAQRFHVTKSTAWTVLMRMGKWILLANTKFKIISWPTRERALEISNRFRNINGFPGVIGCIDGSHVKILAPKENPVSYINRKKFHSILLQAGCDDKKQFIDVFTGTPGSCHDARLFQMSDLSEHIRTGIVQFPNDTHIIGDLAYTLTKTLIVGFKDHGNLNDRQKKFNRKLSQIRVAIEQAFALLKGRFRRLKYLETIRMDLICLLIIVACVLHNVCILNNDNAEDILDLAQEIKEERMLQEIQNVNVQNADAIRREALQKRINIMNNLI